MVDKRYSSATSDVADDAETGSTNPSAPTSIGSGSLTYDTNGNLTAYNATKYTWDYRNRVTAIGNGTATTTFAYDHTFERVKKVGNTTTYYPNDSYSIEGATTTRFLYANGALIATVESNGTATSTRYYHPDHLGGTNVVTSELANVIQTLDYYPYGDTRIRSGSYSAARTYIKELQDLETDLNYLNARYYDNNRGQFLSQDPMFWSESQNLTNPQSFNTYSYAENNPVNRMDPAGLKATEAQKKKVLNLKITLLKGIVNLYKGGHKEDADRAYAAYNTAFGSGKSQKVETTKKSTVTYGPVQRTPNITDSLNQTMRENAGKWADPVSFYFKVKPGGVWDLKRSREYNSNTYYNGFIYNDKEVTSDAPGNIHYGYVGSARSWSNPEMLLQGAGVAQGSTKQEWQESFHGDDPVDQVNIVWGMKLFYDSDQNK